MERTNTTQGSGNSSETPTTEKKDKLSFAEKLKLLEEAGSVNMTSSTSSGESQIGGIVIVGGVQKPKEPYPPRRSSDDAWKYMLSLGFENGHLAKDTTDDSESG